MGMQSRRTFLKMISAAATTGSALHIGAVNAATPADKTGAWPNKPITVYHPFEPCPYDKLSNVYNAELSKVLGVPVNFEYGLMGRAAREVHDGPADGTRVYFAALGPMVLKPNVAPGGKALKPSDFRAVCRATLLPIVVVASKNAPFKTYKEFEAYAKAHPGKVRVALTNFPSSIHSGMTHFLKNIAKLNCDLVTQPTSPLDGAIDTLTGITDVLITHTPDAERFVKHGDFVVLCTFNKTRLSMLPDVPTLRDLGYDYDQTSWRCIVVNKETPDEIVKRLAEATKQVFATEAMQKSAEENWEPLSFLPPEETQKFLEDELKFYEKLTKTLGIHYSQKKA